MRRVPNALAALQVSPHFYLTMQTNLEPTIATMQSLAENVVAGLPPEFADHLRDAVFVVQDFASHEQLRAVELSDPWELTGLYEGRPLPETSIWESGDLPPRISLFRKPLIAEMQETGVTLEALVRHVVIHEVGHHFGFSDDDMHALEEAANQT